MKYFEARRDALGRPEVHSNGFIKVWVGKNLRLHVWHPEIKRHDPCGLHDHRFSFISQILKGRLYNKLFYEIPGEEYRVYTIGDGPDYWKLVDAGRTCDLVTDRLYSIGEGEKYDVPIGQIHDAYPCTKKVASLVNVLYSDPRYRVRVMSPINVVPDVEFARDTHDPEYLWGLVEEVLEG